MEIRYEVEELLSHRGKGATLEYHVKWAKWKETTWEPAENLVGATEALQAYHEKRAAARKPKKDQQQQQQASAPEPEAGAAPAEAQEETAKPDGQE